MTKYRRDLPVKSFDEDLVYNKSWILHYHITEKSLVLYEGNGEKMVYSRTKKICLNPECRRIEAVAHFPKDSNDE